MQLFLLDWLNRSIVFSFRNKLTKLLAILIFSKNNQNNKSSKTNRLPCPIVIRIRLVDGHGTRCCVPRYFRCSSSIRNSISVNLTINYPVSAFVVSLSERIYWLSGKERNELDSFTKSLRGSVDENWRELGRNEVEISGNNEGGRISMKLTEKRNDMQVNSVNS